jgi:PAS domain S-box-containing protein
MSSLFPPDLSSRERTQAPGSSVHADSRYEFVKIILPSALGILLLALFLFGMLLPNVRDSLTESRMEHARELTQAVIHLLGHFDQMVKDGDLTLAEAQGQAKELIRSMRYGPDELDYFWINDLEPTMIMHPYRPDLEGQDLSQMRDSAGNQLFVHFVETARREGAGYVSYYWQWQDEPELVEAKISHIRLFAPWGWITGTGIYLEDVQREAMAATRQVIYLSAFILVIVFLLSAYIVRQAMLLAEKRRFAEAELRLHQEQLEETVAERTLELQTAFAALEKSEERFRMYIDFTNDWEYWISPEGDYIYASPACEKITGYGPEHFRDSQQLLALVHPKDREMVAMHFEERLLERNKSFEIEFRIINRKGGERWLAHVCQPVYGKDGSYMGRRASNRDITERKDTEQQMKLLIELIDRTNDAISVADLNSGRLIFVNEKLCRNLGYTREELLAMSPDDTSCRPAGFFDHHFQELREVGSFLIEDIHRRKDGTTFPVEVSVKYTKMNEQEFAVAVIRDISERRRMEQELQKTQKLESIGLLAGGIAHDFNNILTAILGNISLARMFLPPGEKAIERLVVAEQASLRARGLSQQLLTFAKGGAPITVTTTVPHLIREAVGLALRGSNVRDEYFFPEDLQPVEADESQLNQAISNMALNAVEAMPEGGVLTVTAANESLPPENTLGLLPGKYVRIEIKDQGIGIAVELQERIFDPYFTTKERGSGLGLAISFSIIKRHGGTITLESNPGKGSIFSIFLPASEKRAIATKEEKEQSGIVAGAGRILVMDDEEDVSEVAAEMLQHLGYQVKTTKDGGEAVNAYRQALDEGEPFAGVITDLTVPAGMGGKETVRRLLEIDPQAKVIVSSGYANDPIMSEYASYGFKGVIPKPYKLEELGKILWEVVGEKEA